MHRSLLPDTPESHSPENARGSWLAFAVVLIGSFLGPLAGSITNVALPSIAESYQLDLQSVKWVVLIYLLVTAGLLPVVGRLGGWIGETRMYKTGFAIFTIGTLACALSPQSDLPWLIGSRALQAVGAAMLFGISSALVTRLVPPARRSFAFGIAGSVVAIALISGPPLGVVFCDTLGWRWVFWAQFPVALAGYLLGSWLLPRDPRGASPQISWISLASWALLVSGLVFIGEAFSKGLWINWWPLTAAITLAAVLVFAFAERGPARLFNYSLFRYPAFWRGAITALAAYLGISVMMLFLPFYFEDYLHLPTLTKGLLFGISPLVTVFTGPVSGHLADRIGFRLPILTGLLLSALGYIILVYAGAHQLLLVFGVGMAVLGLGSGLFGGPNLSAMMGSVSAPQRSLASSMSSLTRSVAFLIGVSAGSLSFGLLLLACPNGPALLLASRSEQLAQAVPFPAFLFAFNWCLALCALVTAAALVVCLRFPNRVAQPSAEASK